MRYPIFFILLPLFGYGQLASSGNATDQNGNSFEWINYGSQDWSIENAEIVTYRDGTPIPEVTDDDEWFRLTTGAWCYYDNDPSNSRLYNAYAIIGKHDDDPNTPNKEFAPEGWRVPTNEDWDHLLSSIGMQYSLFSLPQGQMSDGNEGSKLSGSENLWFNNPNNCDGGQNGIDGALIDNSEFNTSGFNWTPDGCRSGAWSAHNPSFCLINEWGRLWSITSENSYYYRLAVTHNLTGLSKSVGINTYGLSARFVRDAVTENCSGTSGNQLINGSFEFPIQPNIGNNFLTWPIDGWDGFGAIPNIVKTNGFISTGGPNNAHQGVQYLDVVGSSADFFQQFNFQCNTQVFFSGYFSVRDNRTSTGRIDLLRVNSNNTTTLVASSNQLNMPSTPNIWYLASGTTVLIPGTYRFNITMGEDSNFDDACFSFNYPIINTGSYGPLCENSGNITLTGTPTDSFGTWSGTGVVDNGNGTAVFNPSGLGGTIAQVSYSHFNATGFGCTQSTDIIVNSSITPIFTQVSSICSGALLSTLPMTSSNGITGTWSPALNNTDTTTYTFTPDAGQCATTETMTITVTPNVTPTFIPVPDICSGATLSALPTTSNNGIIGTWSPALNNSVTSTYTFTPDAGQCATTETMTITVNPNISPTFTQIGPICSGATLAALPTTSSDGITGTWSPELNNNITTTYTFTPDSNQCASNFEMIIDVFDINTYPIPKGISPNGDGKNENWDLISLDVITLKLYNRYGQLVYEKENYTNEWFGQNKTSQSLPDGTYFYVLHLECGTKTGWVYINK